MSASAPKTPGFAHSTLGDFTRDLASRRSVPGGGAAAGSALAHAAALGSMVVAFSRGKRKFEAHEELLAEGEDRLERTRARALELADADARDSRCSHRCGLSRRTTPSAWNSGPGP